MGTGEVALCLSERRRRYTDHCEHLPRSFLRLGRTLINSVSSLTTWRRHTQARGGVARDPVHRRRHQYRPKSWYIPNISCTKDQRVSKCQIQSFVARSLSSRLSPLYVVSHVYPLRYPISFVSRISRISSDSAISKHFGISTTAFLSHTSQASQGIFKCSHKLLDLVASDYIAIESDINI